MEPITPSPYEQRLRIPGRLLPYFRALRGDLGWPPTVARAGGRWRNADLQDVIGHTFDSAKMRQLAREFLHLVDVTYAPMLNGGQGYALYALKPEYNPRSAATAPAHNATLF